VRVMPVVASGGRRMCWWCSWEASLSQRWVYRKGESQGEGAAEWGTGRPAAGWRQAWARGHCASCVWTQPAICLAQSSVLDDNKNIQHTGREAQRFTAGCTTVLTQASGSTKPLCAHHASTFVLTPLNPPWTKPSLEHHVSCRRLWRNSCSLTRAGCRWTA
jgi:hypothetical protein